jgi:peptide chain release factor 1
LCPKDESDERSVIIELRPGKCLGTLGMTGWEGTGGSEASLFASDILEMYRGYAALKGWNFEVLNVTNNDVGGLRVFYGNDGNFNVKGCNIECNG